MKKIYQASHLIFVFLIVGCFTAKKTAKETSRIDLPKTPYKGSETRTVDLLHTKLDVGFNWEREELRGYATLTFKPYFYPLNAIKLDAKGFTIHEISRIESDMVFPLEFTYNDSLELEIQLGKEFRQDDTFRIFVSYTAHPNKIRVRGNELLGDKGLYFINADGKDKNRPQQIWTQGEPQASSCWFPTIDAPNERTTQEISITVKEKFRTLSNGKLENSVNNGNGTRTDTWRMDLPHAPYLFAMAVGEFAKVSDNWHGREVSYYVEPEYEKYARDIFGNTPEMIQFFSDKLGVEFPWVKYSQAVVRDFVSGAMENTTATIHMEGLQQTKRELLDIDYEDYISHELFHQWFGDLVTCESWANLPLNESFATYGEYLWREYKYGKYEADYIMETNRRGYFSEALDSQKNMIRYHYANPDDMFDGHSYSKGGCILHMLRNYVGDAAFFKSLELYLKTNAFQSVEIHNLRLALEAVTGEDLNWFFNQWFMGKGHPILTVEKHYDETRKILTLNVIQQHSAGGQPFRIPVYIDIVVDRKKSSYLKIIDGYETVFTFAVEKRPDLVNFDSKKTLLCKMNEQKYLDEWIFQYELYPDYFNQVEALREIIKSDDPKARELTYKALSNEFWALQKMAAEKVFPVEINKEATLKDKFVELAMYGGNSGLRAVAIDKLNQTNNVQFREIIERMVLDSSYMVFGSSLKAIATYDKDKALKIADNHSAIHQRSVNMMLARLYAEYGNKAHLPYLQRQVNDYDGYFQFTFLSYYNKLVLAINDAETYNEAGIFVHKSGKESKSEYYRSMTTKLLEGYIKALDELYSKTPKDEKQKRMTIASYKSELQSLQQK